MFWLDVRRDMYSLLYDLVSCAQGQASSSLRFCRMSSGTNFLYLTFWLDVCWDKHPLMFWLDVRRDIFPLLYILVNCAQGKASTSLRFGRMSSGTNFLYLTFWLDVRRDKLPLTFWLDARRDKFSFTFG
jgi:hypothetical protein